MKKIIYSLSLVAAMVGFSACNGSGKGGEVDSPKEEMLKKAMTPYVDNTVVATYCGMADAAISLYDQCEVIMQKYEAGTLAETDIKTAAGYWEQARSYWELSEAFLYGPAANHNIDPHIDSWPLDKDGMDAMLGNAEQMAQIEEQGADYVGDKLGYGLLGFHAVEYMLYANDNTDRQNLRYHTTDYKRAEVVYLVAIAEDLRNQAVALETAWAGINNVSATKQAILEEAEIDYGVEFVKGYGSYMKVATGGTYANYQEAAEELIQGCIDIADEVGNVKIGRPATATTEEDRNYIESPYSLNSIVDFMENIVSIKNAYTGSKSGDASVSDYIKTVDADLDAECRAAIDAAYDAIKVIPEPFAVSAKTSEAAHAVKVVGTDLVEVLQKVYNKLGE